ncbi:MAG: DNRLRE domain-containing protein [Methanomethylovorans sp.]|nr:DNRLRE domain-containing protein [Methanomethylovorans sp.]
MVNNIRFNIFERFSAHRWSKSRHVLLIALWLSSSFFSLATTFSIKDNFFKIKDNTTFKKIPVFILGLSFCFLCFSIVGSGLSSAATVYVAADGSGDYNCDGTNDHIEINKALAYTKSIGGGTVYLKGPNTYWIAGTLNIGANTKLTGDSTAEIKLVPRAGWSSDVPIIRGETRAGNIVITGFTIDGNSENQGVSLGSGYYNMMYFENSDNIEVSHMRLEWGCGDGLKIRNSKNIKFVNNDVYKLGHDVLYAIACSNVEFAYNTVFTRTNSACRYADGNRDSTIHDNLIYSSISGDSTGPAIQIATTSTSNVVFDNIEIYNNRIHTINGAGVWMSANYQDNVIHAKNVHIHHNIFTNVGQYKTNTGYSNAAITLGDFDNTIIENNVFDDGGHAAVKWYLRPDRRQQQTQFTTYVRNNIIMNCDGVSSVTGSGVGIWNTNPTYSRFVVQNNNFYNNKNGDTYGGSITMTNNLHVEPQCADSTNSNVNSRDYHLKSTAGRYSNGRWVTDPVSSSLIDAGYSGSAYSNEPSPNGGVINIGRYGDTAQASKSGSTVPNQIDALPVANAGADQTVTVGSAVIFNGVSSTDDNGIASYSWDFDASNGITTEATGATATKTFNAAETYVVTLTVTDTAGQTATDTVTVVVVASGTTTPTGPGTSTSDSVSYSATYDNRLIESYPGNVYSSLAYLDIGRSSTRCRDLMMFDLSGYSTTDTISKATLSLYWYYPSDKTRASDTVVEVYRPVEWDPQYVNWNNRASGTPWSTAGGNWYDKNGVAQGSTPYASLTFPASKLADNQYYELDVTQLVQEYISGKSKNTGFFLKAKTESGDYISFYSSDSSVPTRRPMLTIT